MNKFYLLAFSLFTFSITQAQEQLTSFTELSTDKDSNPTDFVRFNNQLYFLAEHDSYGAEIWVTNGDPNNATLLKDINPGDKDGISYPFIANTQSRSFKTQTAILNNELYFIGNDGSSNGEIWKTDGTSSGTLKVTNFLNHDITNLTEVNGLLYFFREVINHSFELWISDGTNLGTVLIKDNIQLSNSITFEGKVNDIFIFSGKTSSIDNQVWRSDGTTDGTYLLIGGLLRGVGTSNNSLASFIEFNNELYFIAKSTTLDFGDPDLDFGIIKTDGTITNTIPFMGLFDSSISPAFSYSDVIAINDHLYFSFYNSSSDKLLIWKINPSVPNADLIYDEDRDSYFTTSNLVHNNNALIFCGPNASDETSLLSLDLIDYSITEIKELTTSNSASICQIDQINASSFFINVPLSNTSKLGWLSDLTEIGTTNIDALNNIEDVSVLNDELFFANSTPDQGIELWKNDGTENNTIQSDNINPYFDGFRIYRNNIFGIRTHNVAVVNNNVVFGAKDEVNGDEPRAYDNSMESLELLNDINSGVDGCFPGGVIRGYVEYNNEVYFQAYNTSHGVELWKTDGSNSGTILVHDISPGTINSEPDFLIKSNGYLYFFAEQNGPLKLFKTDGINLTEVKYFGGRFIRNVIENNGKLLFEFIRTSDFQRELWISDGTTAGTIEIITNGGIGELCFVNNIAFFTDFLDTSNEIELWKSDGTVAGTSLVKDIGIGYASLPINLTALGNNLIFSAYTEDEGRELWISDGTEVGTSLLKDVFSGSASSLNFNSEFFSASNSIFFTANNGTEGAELWKTDGTESGTELVKDINTGSEGSNAQQFTELGGTVYFQAYEAAQGAELWKTDGTESGTVPVTDAINPGTISSSPRDIISSDNDVFFTAITQAHGRQLWKISDELTLSNPTYEDNSTISIYPNPTQEVINFKSDHPITKVSIFSLNGQLIKSYNHVENNAVNISDLSSGFYLLEYHSNARIYNGKIIKL